MMTAILSKDDYREFTIKVDTLVSKGYELPHQVTALPDGTFEVELIGEHSLEELDKLTETE
tara:strand:+ start:174 stop:356 length:183 start_codon:yes stop_codon:yes gene_type:complete